MKGFKYHLSHVKKIRVLSNTYTLSDKTDTNPILPRIVLNEPGYSIYASLFSIKKLIQMLLLCNSRRYYKVTWKGLLCTLGF